MFRPVLNESVQQFSMAFSISSNIARSKNDMTILSFTVVINQTEYQTPKIKLHSIRQMTNTGLLEMSGQC
jgi:hypothetical protein